MPTEPALEHDQARLRQLDAEIADKVFRINQRAVTPAEIGNAATRAMTHSLGPMQKIGFDWNGTDYELTYEGSKFGYGGAEGNDGYGLWFWDQRWGAPYQSDLEAHVAAWRKPPKPYTTSWDAAGQVVEKMHELGWGMVHWDFWPLSSVARGHNVVFYKAVYPPEYGEMRAEEGDMGRSFPLSCCLAALRALGGSSSDEATR